MTDAEYHVVHVDDLERVGPNPDGTVWRPIRRRVDARAFGVNAWTAVNVGERVIERHRERDGPEELYVVVSGRATFEVGDEERDAPAGTIVFVRPGTMRGAVAAEPNTTVVAVGAKAGEVFEPSPWEEVDVADDRRRHGDVEGAVAIMRELTAAHPDQWQGHYNRACFESVAGDADAAFVSLRRAVELNADEVRRIAPDDEDFDPIRDDPRWTEVIG
jgi:mannose-6-phosphate isomerase-like protein (cupin superfamily)